MGLWKTTVCPECGSPNALGFLWMVKCPRNACSHYDPDLKLVRSSSPAPASPSSVPTAGSDMTGSFSPGDDAVTIRYRNHEEIERNYVGDATTLRIKKEFVSLCLAPKGVRCTFAIDRILNWPDVEPRMPDAARLDETERQIMGYHSQHGSTSPRFEAIKRKLG